VFWGDLLFPAGCWFEGVGELVGFVGIVGLVAESADGGFHGWSTPGTMIMRQPSPMIRRKPRQSQGLG
jgi:hypothetical protein